jgi:hypothetical protein
MRDFTFELSCLSSKYSNIPISFDRWLQPIAIRVGASTSAVVVEGVAVVQVWQVVLTIMIMATTMYQTVYVSYFTSSFVNTNN